MTIEWQLIEKGLDFFKAKSGVKYLSNYSDAQKILDSAIETLQEEGCTVWRPPYYDEDEGIPLTAATTLGGLVGGWTFAGIWCAVSFIALFFLGGPAIADLGTSDWTPTDGVIIDSGVDTSTDGEGGTTYCLWVDYQYNLPSSSLSVDINIYTSAGSDSVKVSSNACFGSSLVNPHISHFITVLSSCTCPQFLQVKAIRLYSI